MYRAEFIQKQLVSRVENEFKLNKMQQCIENSLCMRAAKSSRLYFWNRVYILCIKQMKSKAIVFEIISLAETTVVDATEKVFKEL